MMPGRAEGMEKHIAQDCQSVDEAAKQEMSQLLMTKRLQVICGTPSTRSMHVDPMLRLLCQAETENCGAAQEGDLEWAAEHSARL